MKLQENYYHKRNWWQKLIRLKRTTPTSIEFDWGWFSPRWGLEFRFHRGTYFCNRYAISFCFIWGFIMIYLPFRTKLEPGCEMPDYGFYIHARTINFVWGRYSDGMGKRESGYSWYFDFPWFTYIFENHEYMLDDGSWVIQDMRNYEKPKNVLKETHSYRYVRDSGTVQHAEAECIVERRTWHRKWFPWIKMVRTVIDVSFSRELGDRVDTWKGGTVGCSYDLKDGETIYECLRRMEKERRFR